MADAPRKKLSLKKPGSLNVTPGEEAEAAPPPAPEPELPAASEDEAPAIVDPLAMRDFETTRLKRIKPEGPAGVKIDTTGTDEKFSTETVHLKVIKEKKKQLAGILSASQTIRLRPSGSPEDAAAPAAPVSTEGQSSGRRTLKLKAPVPAGEEQIAESDTTTRPTLKISSRMAPQQEAPPAPADPTATSSNPRATLKIKAPPLPGTGAAPADPTATSSNPRATLKIKAPPGAGQSASPAPAAGAGSKPTLKIKAPPRPDAAAAEASPAETAEQAAPKPGRTLKLKGGPTKEAAPPSAPPEMAPPTEAAMPEAPAAPAPQQAEIRQFKPSSESPGLVYTAAAVASFLIMGGTLALAFLQWKELFGGF